MAQPPGVDRRVNFAEEDPMTLGEKISYRMDQFKEMVSNGCCSCASKCPSVAIVLVSALILLVVLAAIPLTLMLNSSTQKLSSDSKEFPHSTNRSKFWPKVDKITTSFGGDVRGISMQSLFPTNVSTCSGFGFACTDAIHRVIPTSKRCDGIYDCDDKSDEENCKSCQTLFSCPSKDLPDEKSKKNKNSKIQKTMICLTAAQLCDGVQHCPDGSDESLMCKTKCAEDEFKCGGQEMCLPKTARCDGVDDCNDKSDEKDCKTCGKEAHQCGNICVSSSQICDGVAQCKDRSDEKDCDCKSCSGSDKALCDDGTCIRRSQICDGRKDCSSGMDEEECPGSCAMKGSAGKRVTCDDGLLYTEKEACSGEYENCAKNCPKCDSKLAFQCPNEEGGIKKCIPRRMVCDGTPDCGDAADERDCQCDMESGKQFKCDRKCIDVSKKCDGVQDCYDMSDEKNCDSCPSDSFRCPADNSCLPVSSRCNGIADCSDGSDEKKCSCDECVGKHSNTYMCDGTSRCLQRDQVCAPYSMCPNATRTDKAYCAALVLKTQNKLPW